MDIGKYNLTNEEAYTIQVTVSDPTEVKSTLSNYTVYKIKGNDKKGDFECTRRYSDFDKLREILLKRWPGCYIPPLPEKKVVGNSDANFVENRKNGLSNFCKQVAALPHLWYSEEFQVFLRKAGDVQVNLKVFANQNHEDIIKRYDQRLINLRGKSIDTNLLAKVLQFSKYLKRVQPLLAHSKQFLVFFSDIKTHNYDQYSVLYNYLLPEYEKTCLSNYLDQNTSGRLIFSDENDQRLAQFVSRIKQIAAKRNFDQLLQQIQHQERQVSAFLQVYKQHAFYDKKVLDLKQKEKQLEMEQQQLSMGKQGLFKSIFKSNIEQNKKETQRNISVNKDFITTYSLLSDLITMLLGFYQIDRYRETKARIHSKNIAEVAKIQVQFARVQKDLCNHILDNHNLI